MRWWSIAVTCGAVAWLVMAAATAATRATHSPPDQRGTPAQPLVVEQVQQSPSAEALRRDAIHTAERNEDVAYRLESDRARQSADRWTIGAAVATVVILLGQGIAFVYQALALRQSVSEMHAATKVAQQAAESAKTSADAALSANNLSRETFLSEHRPWIKFVLAPVSLKYDNRDGWQLSFQCQLINVGTVVALNVKFGAAMMPHVLASWNSADVLGAEDFQRMQTEATNVGQELERFVEGMARGAKASPVFGPPIFPNDGIRENYGIGRPDPEFAEQLGRRGYFGQLVLLAGVTYKSAVDQSWHHTALAFTVYHRDPSSRIRLVDGQFMAGLSVLVIEALPLADSYVI